MLKNHISAGITAVLFCTSVMVNLPNMAAASTSVNLDRDEVVYQREADSQSKKSNFEYVPQEGIRVGYIITGDDSALLDENTMGYIRRILHTKFPGARYPMERMENIDDKSDWHFHQGRRNTGDTFILTEAHDILSKEFEKLEDMYERSPKRVITREGTRNETTNGISLGIDYDNWGYSSNNRDYDRFGINESFSIGNKNVKREDVIKDEIDSLGADNSYDFTPHLTTLPKEDYVQFARELEEEGLGGYDYIVMFNFKPLRTGVVRKPFGSSRQTDFRLSVRAINVATGKYIERGEYHSRGYSGGTGLHLPILGYLGTGPSWRRAMRRSIIDAMIESFDHMPIGKYSICDNPYCARRQDEIRMEKVFGKSHRHCVKHCNDKTLCYDHMVSYQLDADLPASYVNNEKDQIYTKE